MSRIMVILVCIAFTGCKSCDSRNSALIPVRHLDISFADYTLEEPIPTQTNSDITKVPLFARIYYPGSYQFKNIVEGGSHPLVVFAHGKYTDDPTTSSHLQFEYLLNHLASWGFICISVNFDQFNKLKPYPYKRAELLLHAIGEMANINNNETTELYGHIDMNRIAIVGHSRGGGAAMAAINLNEKRARPWNIKALITLAPSADIELDTVTGNIPHLMLQGTVDGDVKDAGGYKLWDKASRIQPKIYAEIYGANHTFFTDAISNYLDGERLPREKQQTLTKEFVLCFLEKYLNNGSRFNANKNLTYQDKFPGTEYYIQYLEPISNTLVIDSGGHNLSPSINCRGGRNLTYRIDQFEDAFLGKEGNTCCFFGNTRGFIIKWHDSTARLELNFPNTDVEPFNFLCFRSAQAGDQDIDSYSERFTNFKVVLTDDKGKSDTVRIKNEIYRGIPCPDKPALPHGVIISRKSIPSSFRLPLSQFKNLNRHAINRISFLFFEKYAGTISLDDIEFSK